MGTTGPGRTAFGSTQGARADHPPAGLGKAIITGLFGVARPIPAGLNQARIDPSPGSQGFALLGQALTNYTLASATVNISVLPAPLTVTANNANRAYGSVNPAFSAAISGFVNGDTPAVVSGTPT